MKKNILVASLLMAVFSVGHAQTSSTEDQIAIKKCISESTIQLDGVAAIKNHTDKLRIQIIKAASSDGDIDAAVQKYDEFSNPLKNAIYIACQNAK